MSNRIGMDGPYFRAGVLLLCLTTLLFLIAGASPTDEKSATTPRYFPGNGQSHQKTARQHEVAIRFEQGVAMLQLGQYQHAITAFHRVLVLAPRLPEAHTNIGFAFYELRDFAAAERFFRSATLLSPQTPNAYYGLSIALMSQGNSLDALQAMKRYLELGQGNDRFRTKATEKLREIEVTLASQNDSPSPSGRGSEKPTTAAQQPKASR